MTSLYPVVYFALAIALIIVAHAFDRSRLYALKPYRRGKHWVNDQRYGPYIVVRVGLKWDIHVEGSDGLIRRTARVRFWRWLNAARVAQAMLVAYSDGRAGEGRQWRELLPDDDDDEPELADTGGAAGYFQRDDREA